MEKISQFKFASTANTPATKEKIFPKSESENITVIQPIAFGTLNPKQTQIQNPIPIPGVPANVPRSVSADFSFPKGLAVEKKPLISDNLSGKIFVLLGKFKSGKQYLTDLIESHSGVIPKSSHLSCKVSYLLCGKGAEATQKYKRAQQKNIQLLTEEEFLAMISAFTK